jgi:hypothetical protein
VNPAPEESLSRVGLAEFPLGRAWLCDGICRGQSPLMPVQTLIRLFYLGHAVETSQGERNYSERDSARFVNERNSGARRGTISIDLPADAFWRTDPCLRLAASRYGRCRGSCSGCQSDESVTRQVLMLRPGGNKWA